MTIYEQMCRERRWLDHRTPLPLGQVLPPYGWDRTPGQEPREVGLPEGEEDDE